MYSMYSKLPSFLFLFSFHSINADLLLEEWTRFEVLAPQYHLYWKFPQGTSESNLITFQIHAKTLGWVGLGFSPTGTMTGADLVITGLRNGTGYIKASCRLTKTHLVTSLMPKVIRTCMG